MLVRGPAGERERNFPTASSPKDAAFGSKDVCKQHAAKRARSGRIQRMTISSENSAGFFLHNTVTLSSVDSLSL
jgi:hypothetical protein